MLKIKGNAQWAKVFEPDTRFNEDGEYSIQVIVPEEQAAHVCEQLDSMVNAKHVEAVKDNPKLKTVLSTRQAYTQDVDEAGNPTGNLVFKAKMKALVKSKDGQSWEQKPMVVDAKRTPMQGTALIGNGSLVNVAAEPVPYVMAATKQVGVTLRLKAVQVINLVEYGGSTASIFDEEDGYVTSAVTRDDAADVFNSEDGVNDANEGDF
jgi:hypothetical protein